MITFYGYRKCDSCRKAEKALEKAGRPYTFVDITEAPPGRDALRTLVARSGAGLGKFFNTSGVQYRELGIKDKVKTMGEEEVLALLAGNGRLLKRPIVTDGTTVTVGFDQAAFGKTWG